MPSTGEKLERERRALLDVGLRSNPLINYRPLRTSGLTIVDELPSEVFRILVTEERRMSFLSNPAAVSDQEDEGEILFKQPDDDDGELAARYADTQLQTQYSSARLQVRLLRTQQVAKTEIEEKGGVVASARNDRRRPTARARRTRRGG